MDAVAAGGPIFSDPAACVQISTHYNPGRKEVLVEIHLSAIVLRCGSGAGRTRSKSAGESIGSLSTADVAKVEWKRYLSENQARYRL